MGMCIALTPRDPPASLLSAPLLPASEVAWLVEVLQKSLLIFTFSLSIPPSHTFPDPPPRAVHPAIPENLQIPKPSTPVMSRVRLGPCLPTQGPYTCSSQTLSAGMLASAPNITKKSRIDNYVVTWYS